MCKKPSRQVHLDFHTPALPFPLGKNFDREVFQKILINAQVTSITLTGRCHHGFIYYDTNLAAKHPQMQGDFLMEQVDACHEIGLKAPIYLSVGWDAFMAEKHPEWLERQPDGQMYGFEDYGQLSPGWKTLCFNTGYLDYLKAQILDTMKHFQGKLDGLFFDIVWQDPCCCNQCKAQMLEQGMDPTSLSDRKQFARTTEKKLKEELFQLIKEQQADCPIFFNEGNILPTIRPSLSQYSHLEIESLPSGEWGYQHFPTVVRYAKNLGKEYVGMTGKFHKVWADFGSYKNLAALEYESFLAVAHGASCSIGDQMYPDGTLQPATYRLIGQVYQQVAKIETYNYGSQAVTELAILHPGIVEEVEEKVDLSLAGAVNMLNEGHYQFDIVDDQMSWSQYRLLILPDKLTVSAKLATKISAYLNQGGKILASYRSGLGQEGNFLPEWGIDFVAKNPYVPTYGEFATDFFSEDIEELVFHGESLLVNLIQGSVLGEEIRPMYNRTYQHYYSHFQAPRDQKSGYPVITATDDVCYFSMPLFEMYKIHGVHQYKTLIFAGIDYLLQGEKFVTSNLPSTADVVINHQEKEQQIIVNLLHYVPQRKALELDTIEEAISLYHIQMSLDKVGIAQRIGKNTISMTKVHSVSSEQIIEWQENQETLELTIPKIDGYEMIVVEYLEEE